MAAAQAVSQGQPGRQVRRDPRATLAPSDLLGHRGHKAMLARLDQQVHKDQPERLCGERFRRQ